MSRGQTPLATMRLALLLAGFVGSFAAIVLWNDAPGSLAIGMLQRRAGGEPAASTPVANAPQAEDPLDGDPLDGDPGDSGAMDEDRSRADREAPENLELLTIARSGRPSAEPRSLPAYDGDPTSLWQPETDETESWIWFDLGAEQSVREVRWLAEGDGSIEAAVSNDRRQWRALEQIAGDDGWQGVALRDDVRFIRLTLSAAPGEEPPALAEVTIYGRDRGTGVSIEQEASEDRDRRGDRSNRDEEGGSQRRDGAGADETSAPEESDRTRKRGGRVQISTEPGETRCSGGRERCRARQGEVSVEEDCAEEGSCVIDIRADGGTAVCDATGGEESRAGRGEGRRGAGGGSCGAIANGGAVAIGDINP